MKKSKLNVFITGALILLAFTNCTRATEDPFSEASKPPTIEVISPNDNDVYYTSEGLNRQADFHFWGRDDVTVDWISITVVNSSGTEVHYEKEITRVTTPSLEVFRNFSIDVADTYTVTFEVVDTADNKVSATRTIFFEDRVGTDDLSN